MRVGVTGHQKREGIDWSWVSHAIGTQLALRPQIQLALSSLAEGADQVFAVCALQRDIRLIAVVPIENYPSFFSPEALLEFKRLIGQAERIDLEFSGDPRMAFLNAGRYVVDHVDVLFAIWDGQHAAGKGGTGDIVSYAQDRRCPVVHINPLDETIKLLNLDMPSGKPPG
jgi:hypothetical protein